MGSDHTPLNGPSESIVSSLELPSWPTAGVQPWATKVLEEDGFVQLLEGKAKVKKPYFCLQLPNKRVQRGKNLRGILKAEGW